MNPFEERIIEMDNILASINKKLDRIEVGLFGDPEMGYIGLIEAQKMMKERTELMEKQFNQRIGDLNEKFEKRIAAIEQVNKEQEISINAKTNFTDTVIQWAQRIFWVAVTVGVLVYLITGKIGIVDIIKLR